MDSHGTWTDPRHLAALTPVLHSALIDVLSQMFLEQMWIGPTVPSKLKSVGIENVGFNVRPMGHAR